MKSLIIGGTSSLGKSISNELISKRAEIITLSRSPTGLHNFLHFQCDVLEQDRFKSILLKIRDDNRVVDNIWCVVGYAYPKKTEEQTPDVLKRHLDRNFTYVKTTLETLKDSLFVSKNPIVVTLGSQWSYRPATDCPELAPYITAKQNLRKYTQDFALANHFIKANHYCLPTMDTFAYRRIEETFKSTLDKQTMKSYNTLADPNIIARNLVRHVLSFNDSGKILLIKPNGLVELLRN